MKYSYQKMPLNLTRILIKPHWKQIQKFRKLKKSIIKIKILLKITPNQIIHLKISLFHHKIINILIKQTIRKLINFKKSLSIKKIIKNMIDLTLGLIKISPTPIVKIYQNRRIQSKWVLKIDYCFNQNKELLTSKKKRMYLLSESHLIIINNTIDHLNQTIRL
jgi:hypothetical protein